jgi:hypothetical protein
MIEKLSSIIMASSFTLLSNLLLPSLENAWKCREHAEFDVTRVGKQLLQPNS